MSERVIWGSCPSCGERVAVGWTNNEVVEADCYSECELTEEHLAELQRRGRPPAGQWPFARSPGSISNADQG